MSSLINPNCGVPTFVQTDKKLVGDCGSYSGYIFSGIITIILIFVMVSISKSSMKSTMKESEEQKQKRDTKLLFIFLCIVLVWIFLPKIFSFFSVNSWQSYQSQISQYMSQGMSRQDAINKIQSLYQMQLQASAILGAGEEIASARGL
jgi:cell division protein FtsB